MSFDLSLASLIANTLFVLFFVVVGISFMVINVVLAVLPLGRAPFVPTPSRALSRLLSFGGVDRRTTVYDLGSGDGRLVIAAARLNGARAIGIERNLFLTLYARLRARLLGIKHVLFIRGDIFRTPLTGADVIFCYLLPSVNRKLIEKFERELTPGTRIVSRTFSFPDLIPDRTDDNAKLFLYTLPFHRIPSA